MSLPGILLPDILFLNARSNSTTDGSALSNPSQSSSQVQGDNKENLCLDRARFSAWPCSRLGVLPALQVRPGCRFSPGCSARHVDASRIAGAADGMRFADLRTEQFRPPLQHWLHSRHQFMWHRVFWHRLLAATQQIGSRPAGSVETAAKNFDDA